MNRIVVITGASSGIGEKLAALYEASGDTVCRLSRTNPKGLSNYYPCDVASEESVRSALEAIAGDHARIDVLVNNAGVGISGATELLDSQRVESVLDIDVLGAFYASKYALRILSSKGKIVNISSACALFPLPFRTVYCAAKSALQMLSYGMRMELAGTGIQVTAICPGDTKTSFTANRIKDFATSPRYGNRVASAAGKVDDREEKRMSCEKVAKKIFRLIERRKLKAFSIVGAKYRALYFASRILPMSLYLKCTNKLFGGKK